MQFAKLYEVYCEALSGALNLTVGLRGLAFRHEFRDAAPKKRIVDFVIKERLNKGWSRHAMIIARLFMAGLDPAIYENTATSI